MGVGTGTPKLLDTRSEVPESYWWHRYPDLPDICHFGGEELHLYVMKPH